jgi:nucleoside-diphosphate-sugar epimerase
MKKNILITGGCGYVGSKLTENLLNQGKNVRVIDTCWFGNNLKKHKNLKVIKKDIRNLQAKDFKNIDKVIHLANIANDPSVELNQTLAWEVNCLALYKMLEFSKLHKIKQFIYASSGSVYGIKKEKKVTEDLSLIPISTYNKTKMIAERILLSFEKEIKVHIVRPATVCGLSPRMRFDLTVNLLTLQAINNKIIKVFGGEQIRPNIHINDLVNVYNFFINNINIPSGFYNAGFENMSVLKIAKQISKVTGAEIKITKSNDPRSYRQSSEKLIKYGFSPKFKIKDAIEEIVKHSNGRKIKVDDSCYTVKWMKKQKIK